MSHPSEEFDFNKLERPPMECLGMPLDGMWTQETSGIPLSAFVISKSMIEGSFAYQILATEGLGPVECLGMIHWATVILEQAMFESTGPGSTEEEGEAA
jgi:hypothetical protein